jgi:hypothetical protein
MVGRRAYEWRSQVVALGGDGPGDDTDATLRLRSSQWRSSRALGVS